MEGTAEPDSAKCVDIATSAALHEMVVPGISAVLIPVVVGIILGPEALGGLLAGVDHVLGLLQAFVEGRVVQEAVFLFEHRQHGFA